MQVSGHMIQTQALGFMKLCTIADASINLQVSECGKTPVLEYGGAAWIRGRNKMNNISRRNLLSAGGVGAGLSNG